MSSLKEAIQMGIDPAELFPGASGKATRCQRGRAPGFLTDATHQRGGGGGGAVGRPAKQLRSSK
jgi:hypothetical protein